MGLDTFLKAMVRNWWLIALTVVLTVASTAFFTFRQPPVYGAVATLELRPNASLDQANQVTNAMQAIQNKIVINTLARKATTSLVEDQVASRLHIPVTALSDAGLTAAVLPDTGLIEVRAQSTSSELAAQIANTTAQVLTSELQASILQADIIDLAMPSSTPVNASGTRSISLGFAFGLILGVVLALVEFLLFSFRQTHGMATPRLRHLGGAGKQQSNSIAGFVAYGGEPAASPVELGQEDTVRTGGTVDAAPSEQEAAIAVPSIESMSTVSAFDQAVHRNGSKPDA